MIDRRLFLGSGGLALVGLAGGSFAATPRRARRVVRRPAPQDALIDDLQQRTFRYFWDTTDPVTGLAPDRWPTPSFASIAATGFALTAYPIGVANGWISRDQARVRTLATLRFFATAPQGPAPSGTAGHKGFFYHFLDMKSGTRFRQTELSTIDTALLLGGVLFAQSWFDSEHPDEKQIRAFADQIYAAVDWSWFTPRAPFVSMGWHPESGYIPSDWNIYNESLMMYLLALGSPTHPLPPETWNAWTERFAPSWSDRWGQPHLAFPPLFGHQYSQTWVDFRGIHDRFIASKGIDYFENSRRATYAQRDYAIANTGKFAAYGPEIWGLTACDGPGDFKATIDGVERSFYSYSARGPGDRDDGTIAPTAALGSIAFAPEIVLPAAAAMHKRYGSAIYQRYGFLDSFNPTLTTARPEINQGRVEPGIGWIDRDYIGIDQGPILAMIENRRSGLIWRTMHRNAHLRRGLQRAGFSGGWLA
ncbi:glucoamylase family protein [Sphingomonas sp. RB3P16]|uniref:glucoamylase family protein n=1 Tax=Parasphingomonas frigoris TaxID=3096163 RepID=UPI002FC5E32A